MDVEEPGWSAEVGELGRLRPVEEEERGRSLPLHE